MKCTVCKKESNWLTPVGIDLVCNKCIVKNTIFKEMRFSDDKKLNIALKRRKIRDFKELCEIDDDKFQEIFEDKRIEEVNKPKVLNRKIQDEIEEPPSI